MAKIKSERKWDKFDIGYYELSKSRGAISQKNIYEWSEENRYYTDMNTYITIPFTYNSDNEVPVENLYDTSGDKVMLYELTEVLDNLIEIAIQKYGYVPGSKAENLLKQCMN